jgi:hypothetical protein
MAGSPHFIKSAFTISNTDGTLTVSGKEAGLGDEEQIHVELSATALCINPGDKHPRATNKMDVTAAGDFPRAERQGGLDTVRDGNNAARLLAADDRRLHQRRGHRHDQ